MKFTYRYASALVVLLLLAGCERHLVVGWNEGGPGGGVGMSEVIDDEYLVALGETGGAVEAVAAELAAAVGGEVLFTYDTALRGFAVRTSALGAAAALRADPRVRIVEPNYRLDLAPEFDDLAGDLADQQTPYGVRAVGGPEDGTGLRAWVIDTGIDFDHPELNVNETLSRSFVPGTLSADDENGHGTHVAGIIGAQDDGRGVVGVAPNATLVSVRVLGANGSGSYAAIVAGLDYVAAVAAAGDVANLSLGGPASSIVDLAARTTAERGIRLAVAAGNDAAHAGDYSPARVEHPNVLTVSAVDRDEIFAWFSNFGNPPVDFAAPGVRILSTRLGGGSTYLSGTSMAAPHVAGLWLFGDTVGRQGTARQDPDGDPDPLAHR